MTEVANVTGNLLFFEKPQCFSAGIEDGLKKSAIPHPNSGMINLYSVILQVTPKSISMLFANIINQLFPKPYVDETTRKRLLDKFGISGYWYPMHGESKPDNMEYFEIDTFKKYIGDKKLIELIKGLGENEVNAIYEIGDDTTINVEEIVICND